ncbi:MFS transporter [uncultured Mailhella sp.]|uniref:MFS transporter n=1 Tax=uncultured Mailhella sp. TaxID=1981031 RepID=UPI0025EEE708|nr:MFS transporter [uncultured Mailhella sp.]
MSGERKQVLRLARFYFVLLLFCYALAPFHRTVLSTLGVDLMEDFSVGGGLISVMGAAFFYPYAAMQIPAGILADRWGARRTVMVFLTLAAAGTFLFAMATTVSMGAAGRVLTGTGVAMIFVPGLRVILSWFPRRMHPLCTGLFLSLGTGGMFLASWPLNALSGMFGWRWAMMLVALFTCALAVLCGGFLRNTPEDAGLEGERPFSPAQSGKGMPLKEALLLILKSRTYWGVSLWFFCLYGVFYAFSGLWAGPYLLQGYGLDKERASVVLMAISAGAIIGPSLHGAFLSWVRVSKRKLMAAVCLVGMALGVVLILPSPVLPYALLPVWGFFFSVFVGGVGSLGLLKIQEDFPPAIVGTATGMVNIYTALGGGILQMCSGWLMEHIAPGGEYDIAVYAGMFLLFFVLIGVGFLAALLCRPGVEGCARMHMKPAVASTERT